jgi:peptidoglycan/xylan/chitin deacetylase (PgdA/CDA1 family)
MRLPGFKTLRQGARWLQSRFGPCAMVLGYHRVGLSTHAPYDLHVSPKHFAEQLEVLYHDAHPMHLHELVDGLRRGCLSARAVAVTLDDGYADTLHTALPVLERFRVPATIFVATGYVGREFWWDELGRLLRHNDPGLSGKQQALMGIYDARSSGQTYERIHYYLMRLPAAERDAMLTALGALARLGPSSQRFTCLTKDELVQLARSELICVGSHTVTHPELASQTYPEQRWEVESSKYYLESLLGRSVRALSYPNGSLSATTRTLVQEAGYALACGSVPDVCSPRSNPFSLPRFWVPDWGGEQFRRWLRHWLNR